MRVNARRRQSPPCPRALCPRPTRAHRQGFSSTADVIGSMVRLAAMTPSSNVRRPKFEGHAVLALAQLPSRRDRSPSRTPVRPAILSTAALPWFGGPSMTTRPRSGDVIGAQMYCRRRMPPSECVTKCIRSDVSIRKRHLCETIWNGDLRKFLHRIVARRIIDVRGTHNLLRSARAASCSSTH